MCSQANSDKAEVTTRVLPAMRDVGAGRIGLLLVGAIVAMVAIAQLTRMRRPRGDAAEADRPTESV